MEVSQLSEALLSKKEYKLLDTLLRFSKSDQIEERKLAARGFAKISVSILQSRNPYLSNAVTGRYMGTPRAGADESQNEEEFTVGSFIASILQNLM